MFRRAFTHLDNDTFPGLFKAFIRPHLEYANTAWSPYKVNNITAIENVQHRATNQVAGIRNLSIEERLKQLKLQLLVYRKTRGKMIECFKNMGDYNADISPIFKLTMSNTRGTVL